MWKLQPNRCQDQYIQRVDSSAVSGMLLKHGGVRYELRKSLAKIAMWLKNGCPPWAAYRALDWGRLIGLDKNLGVRPLGVGGML